MCSVLLLIVAAAIVAVVPNGTVFGTSFIVDDFARFMKILAYAGSAFAIVMSLDYLAMARQQTFEYPILIVLSTVGMGMLISAGDLIALYLGLELMSLALYVVAASNRDSVRSTEAGPQVFRARRTVVGMLLYGCSLIYGFTGNVSFAGIAKASSQGGIGLIFGLVFLFAGFCFKVSAVPFHMWTPDVYEGAPTRSRRSSRPPRRSRRWRSSPAPPSPHSRHHPAVAADRGVRRDRLDGARRFRRHRPAQHQAADGLFLDRPHGLCAHRACRRHRRRHPGVLVYMAIYLAMTVGAFAVILSMRRPDGMVEEISDLSGLARTNPPLAFFLALLLFSLAAFRRSPASSPNTTCSSAPSRPGSMASR